MTNGLLGGLTRRSMILALVFVALLVSLIVVEAAFIANAEVETQFYGETFEGDSFLAFVATTAVPPGDVVHVPPMFGHLGRPPPVLFLVVEGGEGRAAATSSSAAHVYARAGPDHPGGLIEFRRPDPPSAGSDDALDFVFRVDTTALSAQDTQRLRDEMATQGTFWPYGGLVQDNRIVVLSHARLTLASIARALEWGCAFLMVAFVALTMRRREPIDASGPEAGAAERLARAGMRSLDYLRSVRSLLWFSGFVTLVSLGFGLIVLFILLGDRTVTAVSPGERWVAQTLLLVLALTLALGITLTAQIRRVHREIGRLRRLTPPSIE